MEESGPGKLSLGKALAYLRCEKVSGKNYSGVFQGDDKAFLDSLREESEQIEKLYELKDFLHLSHNVVETCDVYQKQYQDFFISLFLLDTPDKDCYKLARNLNDHFDWFEVFSEVLNDFLLTYKTLKNKQMVM
jgi:hypothetical protein